MRLAGELIIPVVTSMCGVFQGRTNVFFG